MAGRMNFLMVQCLGYAGCPRPPLDLPQNKDAKGVPACASRADRSLNARRSGAIHLRVSSQSFQGAIEPDGSVRWRGVAAIVSLPRTPARRADRRSGKRPLVHKLGLAL